MKKKDGTVVMDVEEEGQGWSDYIRELLKEETEAMDDAAGEREGLLILE